MYSNQLQEKLLDILVFFHNFCAEHNLRYYAVGGTALGAARHHGFIPWDDDVDVGMPRRDYEQFKELSVQINRNTDYFAEFPSEKKDFVYPYCKLYDTRTTLIENTRFQTKRGIYLDIFPLDGLGDTKEEAFDHFKKIDRVNNILCTRVCGIRKGRKWYKNLSVVLSRCIPDFLLDPRKMLRKLDDLSKQKDFDGCKYVANISGNWHAKEIQKREVFGSPTRCQFEHTEIYIPEKIDEYLTGLYGDWRKLPSVEERASHHDYLFIDLEESYCSNH